MKTAASFPLKTIATPRPDRALRAPPVFRASATGKPHACGSCGITLLYADDGQVHHVIFRCTMCGIYNITDG
jgi:predicted RNA-binding Zn-ribbon protein involved in translation (DUF1610 family)